MLGKVRGCEVVTVPSARCLAVPASISQKPASRRRDFPSQDRANPGGRPTADHRETDAATDHGSIPRRRAALPPAIKARSFWVRPSTSLISPRGSFSPMSYG